MIKVVGHFPGRGKGHHMRVEPVSGGGIELTIFDNVAEGNAKGRVRLLEGAPLASITITTDSLQSFLDACVAAGDDLEELEQGAAP